MSTCAAEQVVRDGQTLASPGAKTALAADDLAASEIQTTLTPIPPTERAMGIKAAGNPRMSITRSADRTPPTRLVRQATRYNGLTAVRQIGAAGPRPTASAGNLRPSVVKRTIAAAPRTAAAGKNISAGGAARVLHGASLAPSLKGDK